MPVYEFFCPKCDKSVALVKSIHENTQKSLCETCNLPMNRVYSSVGVTFNGSGFYSTDGRGA